MYCDLHIHSTYSDGTFTPKEIVALAKEKGLCAIALTDHNNIDGLEEFEYYAKKAKIEFCGGCEFTTEFEGKEVHLLGLFLPQNKYPEIKAYLQTQIDAKEQSNIDCLNNLSKAGYPVSYKELKDIYKNTYINRVHIAKLLLKKNIVSSINGAFDTLLNPENKYYNEPSKLDFAKTVQKIKEWGGVSVIAHPTLDLERQEIEKLLTETKPDGIEIYHSSYGKSEEEYAKELASKYNLLQSGGTDFHGANKPDIDLGYLNIPYSLFENLKNSRE